ncbi:MAG: hypothetical protein ACHQD6_07865 [Steroidobacterales bacterium]
MNEIQLIRAQLATERSHVSRVANAGAAGSPAPQARAADVNYLVCVLGWFEARDRRLTILLRADSGLQAALAQPGASGEALGRLPAADSAPSWQAFAHFIDTAWGPRRDALDARLAMLTRAAEWRQFAGIDADSILEERRLFAASTAGRC